MISGFKANGHFADVQYIVFKVQVCLCLSFSLHDESFPIFLGLTFSIYYHIKQFTGHFEKTALNVPHITFNTTRSKTPALWSIITIESPIPFFSHCSQLQQLKHNTMFHHTNFVSVPNDSNMTQATTRNIYVLLVSHYLKFCIVWLYTHLVQQDVELYDANGFALQITIFELQAILLQLH